MIGSLIGIIASSGGAVGGDYESIATVTVGSGGASSVSFTGIPSTYTHLQIRGFAQTNRGTFGRDAIISRFNSDTGNNYAWHQLVGFGGAPDGTTNATGAASAGGFYPAEVGTTTGSTYGAFVLDVLDYANVNKYKTARSIWGGDHNGTIANYGGTVGIYSGLWQNTNAITSISFNPGSGTLISQYSSFALYGIKG